MFLASGYNQYRNLWFYLRQVEQPFSVWETPGDHIIAHMVSMLVNDISLY